MEIFSFYPAMAHKWYIPPLFTNGTNIRAPSFLNAHSVWSFSKSFVHSWWVIPVTPALYHIFYVARSHRSLQLSAKYFHNGIFSSPIPQSSLFSLCHITWIQWVLLNPLHYGMIIFWYYFSNMECYHMSFGMISSSFFSIGANVWIQSYGNDLMQIVHCQFRLMLNIMRNVGN